MKRLLFALTILMLAPAAVADEASDRLDRLRGVMIDRLAVMSDVAKYKWNAGLPVEDRERESVVLEATVSRATAAGADPEVATRAVQSQIAAAKLVQTTLFRSWTADQLGAFADAPSLTDTLRPEIGRLTGEMIAALAETEDDRADCAAADILSPVPDALTDFAEAWRIAVAGVLPPDCP